MLRLRARVEIQGLRLFQQRRTEKCFRQIVSLCVDRRILRHQGSNRALIHTSALYAYSARDKNDLLAYTKNRDQKMR